MLGLHVSSSLQLLAECAVACVLSNKFVSSLNCVVWLVFTLTFRVKQVALRVFFRLDKAVCKIQASVAAVNRLQCVQNMDQGLITMPGNSNTHSVYACLRK